MLVVADAETVLRRAADGYVGAQVARQLRGADLIVLSKVDLVGPEERGAVERGLRALEPRARVVAASHGAVPLPVLLGGYPREPDGAEPGPHDDQSDRRTHQEEYATWSCTGDAPLDGEAFREAIAALPEGVLRAKGIVSLAEDRERRYVLQLVGKRWSLTPGEPWGADAPRTRLALIGLPGSIDEHALPLPLLSVTVESLRQTW